MKKAIAIILSFMLVMAITFPAVAISTIAVKSIKLDKSSISLKVGQTYNLKAIFTPSNTTQKLLTYVTGNKKIATVNTAGKIVGVSSGTTTITVFTSNKKILAKCKVTISQVGTYLSKDKITLSWMTMGVQMTSAEGVTLFNEIEKRTNIKLKMMLIDKGQYADKQNITIASGQLPDIMQIEGINDVQKYGKDGAFVDFSQYSNLTPDFNKLKDKYPEIKSTIMDSEGHLYGLPRIYDYKYVPEGLMIREDALKKNNISLAPKTLNDFYNVLKELKTKYPNSKPFMARWGLGHLMSSIPYMAGTGNGIRYDSNSKKYEFGPLGATYKEIVTYLNKLYKDGLLDPDFAMSNQVWEEKLFTDKSFVTFDYVEQNDDLTQRGQKTNSDFLMGTIEPIMFNGEYGKVPVVPSVLNFRLKVVSTNSKHKDEAIKLLNYFYSPDGIELTNWGVKNATFVEEGGKKVAAKDIKTVKNPNGTIDPQKKFGINLQTEVMGVVTFGPQAEYYLGPLSSKGLDILALHAAPLDPIIAFTTEENDKIKQINTPLSTYIDEQTMKFILGNQSFDKWDGFIAEIKKLNAEELVDLYNSKLK